MRPGWGALQALSFVQCFQVLRRTAAEATRNDFVKFVFWSFCFVEPGECAPEIQQRQCLEKLKLIRSPRYTGCYQAPRHNVTGSFANFMLEVFRHVPIIGFK
jgi:hypothetical protein